MDSRARPLGAPPDRAAPMRPPAEPRPAPAAQRATFSKVYDRPSAGESIRAFANRCLPSTGLAPSSRNRAADVLMLRGRPEEVGLRAHRVLSIAAQVVRQDSRRRKRPTDPHSFLSLGLLVSAVPLCCTR